MTVDQARSVAAGNDFYVPAFKVQIRNRVLPPDVIRDVMQVTYKDSIEEIDSFELTVNNWDAGKRAFKYSDGDLFLPGRDLELWMGYYGKPPLRLMLKGKIKSLRPTFPASGQPTLAVSGLNVLDQYRTKQESHTYSQMTDSEIAQQIAKRLGHNGANRPGVRGQGAPLRLPAAEERVRHRLLDPACPGRRLRPVRRGGRAGWQGG